MSEDFGHRRLVIDLSVLTVLAVLLLVAVLLLGWVALLIVGLWVSVGTALGFLIGPMFETEDE